MIEHFIPPTLNNNAPPALPDIAGRIESDILSYEYFLRIVFMENQFG